MAAGNNNNARPLTELLNRLESSSRYEDNGRMRRNPFEIDTMFGKGQLRQEAEESQPSTSAAAMASFPRKKEEGAHSSLDRREHEVPEGENHEPAKGEMRDEEVSSPVPVEPSASDPEGSGNVETPSPVNSVVVLEKEEESYSKTDEVQQQVPLATLAKDDKDGVGPVPAATLEEPSVLGGQDNALLEAPSINLGTAVEEDDDDVPVPAVVETIISEPHQVAFRPRPRGRSGHFMLDQRAPTLHFEQNNIDVERPAAMAGGSNSTSAASSEIRPRPLYKPKMLLHNLALKKLNKNEIYQPPSKNNPLKNDASDSEFKLTQEEFDAMLCILKMRKRQKDAQAASAAKKYVADACSTGNVNSVVEYLFKDEVHIGDELIEGMGALHVACLAGQVEVVRLLLELGARPNATRDEDGNTPLMALAWTKYVKDNRVVLDCAKALIEAGGDVDAKQPDGMTALLHAVERGNTPMVQFLLSVGADPYIENIDAEDAFVLANSTNVELMNVLNTHRTIDPPHPRRRRRFKDFKWIEDFEPLNVEEDAWTNT